MCCFSGLEIGEPQVFKNVDKCVHHHVDYYINIVERDLEKVPELVATYILEKLKLGETITIIDIDKEEEHTLKLGDQILISGNKKFMGLFEITEKGPVHIKKYTIRELVLKDGKFLPNTIFIIKKGSTFIIDNVPQKKSWSAVRYNDLGELIHHRVKPKSSRYVITWNRRPIQRRRYGRLPIILDRLFKNNVERDLKKGYLKEGKSSIVLREGVSNNNKNSFICAIINKLILKANTITVSDVLKDYIEDLTLDEFLKVNNGDLVQQFAPNIENKELRDELVEKNFDLFIEFAEKHKSLFKTPSTVQARKYSKDDLKQDLDNSNPNRNKKISKKNKKIREIFLTFLHLNSLKNIWVIKIFIKIINYYGIYSQLNVQ